MLVLSSVAFPDAAAPDREARPASPAARPRLRGPDVRVNAVGSGSRYGARAELAERGGARGGRLDAPSAGGTPPEVAKLVAFLLPARRPRTSRRRASLRRLWDQAARERSGGEGGDPSPRPVKPIPSFVVNSLPRRARRRRPRQAARASHRATRPAWAPRTTVESRLAIDQPSARTAGTPRRAARSSPRHASARRCRESGGRCRRARRRRAARP